MYLCCQQKQRLVEYMSVTYSVAVCSVQSKPCLTSLKLHVEQGLGQILWEMLSHKDPSWKNYLDKIMKEINNKEGKKIGRKGKWHFYSICTLPVWLLYSAPVHLLKPLFALYLLSHLYCSICSYCARYCTSIFNKFKEEIFLASNVLIW